MIRCHSIETGLWIYGWANAQSEASRQGKMDRWLTCNIRNGKYTRQKADGRAAWQPTILYLLAIWTGKLKADNSCKERDKNTLEALKDIMKKKMRANWTGFSPGKRNHTRVMRMAMHLGKWILMSRLYLHSVGKAWNEPWITPMATEFKNIDVLIEVVQLRRLLLVYSLKEKIHRNLQLQISMRIRVSVSVRNELTSIVGCSIEKSIQRSTQCRDQRAKWDAHWW
jgi:hypothetical protein